MKRYDEDSDMYYDDGVESDEEMLDREEAEEFDEYFVNQMSDFLGIKPILDISSQREKDERELLAKVKTVTKYPLKNKRKRI